MEKYDKKNIKLPKALYDRIENDVVNLYIELGLTVPIKPEEIAKRLGFIARKMSEMKDKEKQLLLRFDKDGNQRDGYSFYDPLISTYICTIRLNGTPTPHQRCERFAPTVR